MRKFHYKIVIIAIYEFLSLFYSRGYNDGKKDLGGFLGSLMPSVECIPMDQGLMEDWKKVVGDSKYLSTEESYLSMIKFLKLQASIGWPEIYELLKIEKIDSNSKYFTSRNFVLWRQSLEKSQSYI